MSEAVRFQLDYWSNHPDGLHEGDVLVSNHPQLAGGSHLPDITVITPVFEGGRVVFCVASRGHHADIGMRRNWGGGDGDWGMGYNHDHVHHHHSIHTPLLCTPNHHQQQ